jgi:hypothetical protein
MTTFTVQANTTVNSDQMFGPLGFGDLEQVFGSATNTTILGGGLQEVFSAAWRGLIRPRVDVAEG